MADPKLSHWPYTEEIDSLREQRADRLDPARFRFIESMAQRAAAAQGPLRDVLATRVEAALGTYRAALDKAVAEGRATLGRLQQSHPEVAGDAAALLEQHAFHELRRLAARLDNPLASTGLGGLIDVLNQQQQPCESGMEALLKRQDLELLQSFRAEELTDEPALDSKRELKSARLFRTTMQRSGAKRRLSQASREAPEESGPLNPQKLVTESLLLMGRLSPAYLDRFIAYADTLLWLEQARENQRQS